MRRTIVILAGLAILSAAAAAQEEEDEAMEEQRCVWRCLYGSQGASDPAYHQCVADSCGERPAPAPKQSVRPRNPKGWQQQRHDPSRPEMIIQSIDGAFGINLSCDRSPQTNELKVGLFLAYSGDWRLDERQMLYFDGKPFEVEVGGSEDGVTLSDMPIEKGVSGDFLDRLRSGSFLAITGRAQGDQPRVALFDMAGGESAFQDFEAACRRIGT